MRESREIIQAGRGHNKKMCRQLVKTETGSSHYMESKSSTSGLPKLIKHESYITLAQLRMKRGEQTNQNLMSYRILCQTVLNPNALYPCVGSRASNKIFL